MDFEEVIVDLLRLATTELPADVSRTLKEALKNEGSSAAKTQLKAIIKNFELALEETTPMCQDTGYPTFYVEIGEKALLWAAGLKQAIVRGTERATREVPLRPNTVYPIKGGNPGTNLGRGTPFISFDIVEGNQIKITAAPKGGGSENMSALGMLKPGQGISGIKKFVVDTVIAAGAQPCPPIIVGVGIGGGADIAMKVAKKQLLRPIGERHPEKEIAKMEEELLQAINATGIGAMGVGGEYTALDVKVDYVMRHPATLPVGVAIQCWAGRRATAEIAEDGTIKFLTHEKS
ncbi:MAG: fumarate hydratase [Candidatus Hodarchaeales archaeon]|jgi:fumarate hydratase subunit alpha